MARGRFEGRLGWVGRDCGRVQLVYFFHGKHTSIWNILLPEAEAKVLPGEIETGHPVVSVLVYTCDYLPF